MLMSTLLTWVLLGLYLLIVAGTVVAVILENRQPERTIAWVVAIILLPFIGLIFFYFFGQNIRSKHRRRRYHHDTKHSELLSKTNDTKAYETSDSFFPLKRLCSEEFGAPLLPLEQIDLIESGRDFFTSLIEACNKAVHHIFLETYIIEDDEAVKPVCEALIAAAQRGVDVRLLYDDVGCWRVSNRFFNYLQRGGVKVAAFMPVHFPSLTHKINYRNHRKICVVDDRLGFIGGMNLAQRYLGDKVNAWRDLHARLTGQVVLQLTEVFLSDWAYVTESATTYAEKYGVTYGIPLPCVSVSPERGWVQIVKSDPLSAVPQLLTAYTWAAMHARDYLYIQTPYFMPTESFLQAIKTAAMIGADVRVMMPRKPDGKMLRRINDSYVSELLSAGVRVYQYEGVFLHTKSIIVDDLWCSIGSANMDFRSFLNNIEIAALIYDKDTAEKVRLGFERDIEQSREILLARWSERGLHRRFVESITRILSPLF